MFFLKKESVKLLEDSSSATMQNSKLITHIILWTVAIFIIIFILWAKYAILDEVASAQGKVIPSSQIQILQNLEGGIVKKILVKQGDMVKRGQEIMILDDTLFNTKKQESEKKMVDLKIELTRLKAEIDNKPLIFDAQDKLVNPSLVEAEYAFFLARQTEMNQMKREVDLASKEYNMTQPLIAKGAASPVEVLRLERTVSELQGKINAFNSKTLERYNQAKGEYDNLKEEFMADQDRVRRTVIRSPVRGVIKQLKINTEGGVIKPGMDIVEIVPLDDTLLIEAKVLPKDIGFIHQGQQAMVKISAYDFSIYGGLDGTVETISADTIIDELDKKQESFYLIQVRTKKNYLGTKEKPLYIIPGMQATVDVLTGRKSVLDYLLKPILKAKSSALRER